VNVFFGIGNLTRDAELRYTNSGTAVCNFTFAMNKKFKETENVTYVDCVAWGKYGELISENLKKGKKVGVVGELNQKHWEKDGEKHSRYEITVREVEYLSPKDAF